MARIVEEGYKAKHEACQKHLRSEVLTSICATIKQAEHPLITKTGSSLTRRKQRGVSRGRGPVRKWLVTELKKGEKGKKNNHPVIMLQLLPGRSFQLCNESNE